MQDLESNRPVLQWLFSNYSCPRFVQLHHGAKLKDRWLRKMSSTFSPICLAYLLSLLNCLHHTAVVLLLFFVLFLKNEILYINDKQEFKNYFSMAYFI